MAAIKTRRLSEQVGVEVLDVDVDRLLNDDDLPDTCMEALEEHGVLLFRELNATGREQAAFGRRLGDLVQFPGYPNPEVMEISFDPANPNAEYFASNDYWHFDGAFDEIPAKAALLSAQVVAPENLTGTFDCCQAVLPDMVDAGWGRIVNISSSSVHSGARGLAGYVAAKSGVVGLTKVLALEFAPHGITVNTIPPGFVDTPMLRNTVEQGFVDVDRQMEHTPVGRIGRPEDIAAACAFLAGDEAGYITGQVLGVNGGRNM